jgi:hypothetical protein
MTQADRVLSTPPTNTSALPVEQTRRRLLTIAAGAAVAAASPATAEAAALAADPIYAAIERYKVLFAEYTAAVDRSAPLEVEDPDWLEAENETSRTGTALFEQMDLIFTFRPSTVAGVAALLKYISTLKDWQMAPGLEDGDSMKAVKTLCTCLAAAIEQSGVLS